MVQIMESQKDILMVIPVMHGGGAERVATLLLNEFKKQGHNCEVLLTNDKPDKIVRNELSPDIPINLLQDLPFFHRKRKSLLFFMKWYSTLTCRFFELIRQPVPSHFAYCSFVVQYHREIEAFHEYLKKRPRTIVITFLQPSIPIVLLATRHLVNYIVFSERGDAKRLMRSRYGQNFIEKYYKRANAVVFQTEEAKNAYPSNISDKGHIIINPITSNLPNAFDGERKQIINTFCRISKQKNLPLLINAFYIFHKIHPEYKLHIIGSSFNEEGDEVLNDLRQIIKSSRLEKDISFIPFSQSVHNDIKNDSIYVNSSDYEGISNAMLEAMAIGLPTICTDCPVGGARTIIRDHWNGILVPVRDVNQMANAMIEVIDNPELSRKMSENGRKIRKELNIENIAKQWLEVL